MKEARKGWRDGRKEGRKGGREEGWKKGWKEGWKDKFNARRDAVCTHCCSIKEGQKYHKNLCFIQTTVKHILSHYMRLGVNESIIYDSGSVMTLSLFMFTIHIEVTLFYPNLSYSTD